MFVAIPMTSGITLRGGKAFCAGNGMLEGSCDCDGNVWDACNVCGGDGTTCVHDRGFYEAGALFDWNLTIIMLGVIFVWCSFWCFKNVITAKKVTVQIKNDAQARSVRVENALKQIWASRPVSYSHAIFTLAKMIESPMSSEQFSRSDLVKQIKQALGELVSGDGGGGGGSGGSSGGSKSGGGCASGGSVLEVGAHSFCFGGGM